jgi:TonB family protein
MNCVNCGSALAAGARFCPNCGRPAAAASPQPPPQQPPPQYGAQGGGQQQWQTSWDAGARPGAGVPPPPRRKSRLGKILLIVFGILLVIGVGAGVAVYYGYKYVESTLKNSEAYQVAVDQLKNNKEASEYLGEVKSTGFPIGSFNESAGGTGSAAFTMSVEGSKASGQYAVTMNRTGGKWSVADGYLRTADGRMIDVTTVPVADGGAGASGAAGAVTGVMLDDKVLEKPEPAYPQLAKSVRASGRVVVQVSVDERGRVTEARAVSGHPLLRASAEAAARRARFSQTVVSGKPVRVTGLITYDFKPQ